MHFLKVGSISSSLQFHGWTRSKSDNVDVQSMNYFQLHATLIRRVFFFNIPGHQRFVSPSAAVDGPPAQCPDNTSPNSQPNNVRESVQRRGGHPARRPRPWAEETDEQDGARGAAKARRREPVPALSRTRSDRRAGRHPGRHPEEGVGQQMRQDAVHADEETDQTAEGGVRVLGGVDASA